MNVLTYSYVADIIYLTCGHECRMTYQGVIVDHAIKYYHNNIELYNIIYMQAYTGLLLGDFSKPLNERKSLCVVVNC